MPPLVHLAVAQFKPRKAEYRANLDRLGELFAQLDELEPRPMVLALPETALTGYFLYHLVEGDRGLRAWVRVAQELRLAKETLSAVAADRTALERRVSHMRPDQVDPDLLDSQARRTLDVVSPDEIVIIQPLPKR